MGDALLVEALGRFMSSPTLRDARDAVRDTPELLSNPVLAYLEEAVRQSRQRGDEEFVEKLEHWLGIIRMFRRFGVEDGYLEVLAGWLAAADHARTVRLLTEYPELASDAARGYFERREAQSHGAKDQAAASIYQLAALVPAAKLADSTLGLDLSFVGGFLAGYVREDDDERRHRYLLEHPELLRMPTHLVADSTFQPDMDQAWADVELVILRDLYRRRAAFRRAGAVGAAQAIQEYEEGAEWPDLLTR